MDKPTFFDVIRDSDIKFAPLAERAEVNTEVINRMVLGHEVSRENAEKVLRALSAMTGQQYSLETVDVTLSRET